MRRAAMSIPSNLAEGACRHSRRAYAFHVSIALGSHAELETCLELAQRVGCLGGEDERLQLTIDGGRTALESTASSTAKADGETE